MPTPLGDFTQSPVTSLSKLVNYLTEKEPDPVLRLKNIHDWIATHIAYDSQSFFSGTVPAQSWVLTLRSGRAVCQGYAELFSEMMTMAGFQNQIVTGYSRGYGYSPLSSEYLHSNHAWNMVLLSDGWYLMDVTWDSGYVHGRSFHRRYSASYFLLPPNKMIYSHFPDDAALQLLPHPINAHAFLLMPRLGGEFFSFDITNYAQLKRSYTVSGEGEIHLSVGNEGGVSDNETSAADGENDPAIHLYLTAHIRDQDGHEIEGSTFVESTGGTVTIYLRPRTTGPLILDVYGARRPDAQVFGHIWSTQLIVTSPASIGFPHVYRSYFADGARLQSPVESPLRIGAVQKVRISVPGATKVAVVAGRTWLMLTRDDDDPNLFYGELTVPPVNELGIFASFDESQRYRGLVRFSVQ